MKQRRFIRSLAWAMHLLLVASLLAGLSATYADQAQYFYDALGRLSTVVDGQGNAATYNYDAVGNLLSITRGGAATAPTITAISPDTIDAGTSVPVTISGTGLQISSVTTSNPEILINNVATTTTAITATVFVPNPTTFGATTVTVTTPGGTATTSLTVRQATPTITQLTPDGGVVGTTVVIAGTGFGTKGGSNRVTFAGLGGVRLPATVLTENNTNIKVTAPSGVAAGPVTVEVGGLTSNEVVFKALTLTAIVSTAAQGTAANAGLPSANMGQLITVQGAGFSGQTRLVLPTVDDAGTPGTFLLPLTNVSADGTTAQAPIPAFFFSGSVVTGPVTIRLANSTPGAGSVTLQIVPVMFSTLRAPGTDFSPSSTAPGSVVGMLGTGFEPNNTQVRFPGIATPVPANRAYAYPFDVSKMEMDVTIPSGIGPGPITITTNGGTSNAGLVNAGIRAINAVAAQGVPLNPAVASANTGQSIQLQGAGFSTFTSVLLSNGAASAAPFSVSADGTLANVIVPSPATTGLVTYPFAIFSTPGVSLQIVPTVLAFTLPPGEVLRAGVVVTIVGSGFKDGVTTVTFPGASPVSPTSIAPGNGGLTVTAPADIVVPPPGTVGVLTVATDGGTSNTIRLGHPLVAGIVSTAARGTPTDAAQPSATVGQSMTLNGSGFTTMTQVVFQTFDSTGAVGTTSISPDTVSPDGTSLTVTVPFSVVSGPVSVLDVLTGLGDGSVTLQIVSTIDSASGTLNPGDTFTLQGNGFDPSGTQVQFPGVAQPVAADSASIMASGGTQATVTVPAGVTVPGQLTVSTAGGTSNPFDVGQEGEVEPNDSPATATLLPIDPNTFEVTKSGTIDPPGDVEYFKFMPDLFNIGPAYAVEVLPSLVAGPPLNIRLTWFDQDGVTVLATAEGVVDASASVSLFMEPPVNGGYFLQVEELTGQGGPDRTYQIHLFAVAF